MVAHSTLRLRVIQASEDQPSQQDCSTCRNQKNCWDTHKIRNEHIIINLLVCRLKRGIEVNRSTKLLLQMLRPELKNLTQWAIRGTNIDAGMALADLESYTIELILKKYVMGGVAYPLHWLFGRPHGYINLYANNYAKKTRQYESMQLLSGRNEEDEDDSSEPFYDPRDEEEDTTKSTRVARDIIDDGITLTLQEYRILKFCLSNASDAKRPLSGLHVYLGQKTGLGRAKVTRIMKDASDVLVRAVQEAES